VVNCQLSKYGGQFAVNLGIQPMAIPNVRGEQPDPMTMTAELCEFRRRLSELGGDHWWAYEPTLAVMEIAVRQASDVYVSYGRPGMQRFTATYSAFLTVAPDDFRTGRFDFAGLHSTQARMALALARLRCSAGRLDESRAFAAIGLEACGENAIMLRRDLQALY
jgi:hypothetical protein